MPKIGSLFYKQKPRDKEVSQKRWNIPSMIWTVIKRACMALGAMVLISTLISVFLISKMTSGSGAKSLPNDMVLVFKIENGVTELQSQPSFLEPFPFTQPTLRNVINTIDKAKNDDRVRGIVFSLKGGGVSLSHVQELRGAIARFQESGKFTKIYASSYASGVGGLSQYYLASIFDEIWMQPVGMVSISGIDARMPFAKDLMDKVGVSAEFLQREEFKSAMENFTNSNISDENKAVLTSIFENLTDQMIDGISLDRDLDKKDMIALMNKAILTGKEAVEAKLIDRLDYADVLLSEIRESVNGDPEDETVQLVNLGVYSQSLNKTKQPKSSTVHNLTTKNNVALIYVVGAIMDTASAQASAGADEISATITEAYNDESIDAIVLRVDSPGGSPSASETIRRALVKAQEKGKKVIVSMGPVAASGGYWVSTHADYIYATPATLTGSIGVVMGKFQAQDLWKKMGVNWEGPQIGENADIWSFNEPFDAQALERMNVLIDETYEQFLVRVSEGRGIAMENARRFAKGRAFTGEQARNAKLVDDLGGLEDALEYTAKVLGGDDKSRENLNVIKMPRDLNGVERFLDLLGQEVSIGQFLGVKFGLDSAWFKKLRGIMTKAQLVQDQPTVVYDSDLEFVR